MMKRSTAAILGALLLLVSCPVPAQGPASAPAVQNPKPSPATGGPAEAKPARPPTEASSGPTAKTPADPATEQPEKPPVAAREPEAPGGVERETIKTTDQPSEAAATSPMPADDGATPLEPPEADASQPDTDAVAAEPSAAGEDLPTNADDETAPAAQPEVPDEGESAPRTRERRAPAPTSAVVSRATEQTRARTVRRSLEGLGKPATASELTQAGKLTLVADLVLSSRMQLAALHTEMSRATDEKDAVERKRKSLDRQTGRLSALMRQGKLPLLYAHSARDQAEETVTEMNELFDRAIKRRSQLAENLEGYREDSKTAARVSRQLRAGAVSTSLRNASGGLQDRIEAVESLMTTLDETIIEAVAVSEVAAQLSMQLTGAIRATESRRLLTRTSEPLTAEAVLKIGEELTDLRDIGLVAVRATGERVGAVNVLAALVVTIVVFALFVLLWRGAGVLPGRLLSTESTQAPTPPRMVRAVRLLVPAARAAFLMALCTGLAHAWGLPEGWADAAVTVLSAWLAYYLLCYLLRELLAPQHAQFRILKLRDEAAGNLYSVLHTLALYTVIVLPLVLLLNALEERPTETIRALQIVFGLGLLLVGGWMTRRSGGLPALLPTPETRHKSAVQEAARLVVPICALGILGGVVSAAGGYSNLSAYLSRSLILEVLLLVFAVFVDNLALEPLGQMYNEVWRKYARWLLWALVIVLQWPIWRLQAYHAMYVIDLLQRPMLAFNGREVSGASIFKGIIVVLVVYGIARYLRVKLQSWDYLATRFQAGVAYALSSLAFYIILAAGLLWGILVTGFELSVLTVFAGMAGIGLGFGLQDVVKNFVSGLILLIERPVAVGDFVEVEGLRGHITAINLRSTTIRSRENNVVLVPNSDLASTRVTNLTLSDPRVRITIDIGVSYNCDLDLVSDVVLECVRSNPLVMNDPEPKMLLMNFGESSVDFALWAWVDDADMAIAVAPELRKQVWDAFARHNIEIPFPQHDLHIRSSDVPLAYPGPDRDAATKPGAPQEDSTDDQD